MKRATIAALACVASLAFALPTLAQTRVDYIWARATDGPITMDGVLNEPAWALADSMVIKYGQDSGIPGSGWFNEAGILPQDPTNATVKFLHVGNYLWMGAVIRDKSIGGSSVFNRFDGLLMGIKDHSTTQRPAPPLEYFYSWWYPEDSLAAIQPDRSPNFRGRWTGCNDSPSDCSRPRTATEIDAWDAVTTVNGHSNTDATNDVSYTIEMRFNLTPIGYNMNTFNTDAVEFNVSIYDADWNWPFQNIFSSNRTWWEGPWGRDAFFHNVKILGNSAIRTNSGPAPGYPVDARIPAGDNFAAPTMDGLLTDPVWNGAPALKIKFGDDALRASYPGVGPWRSGQYQPEVNGGQADVVDPGNATVKWFYKGTKLYLGFDVNDKVVQYISDPLRWDGFIVSLVDYAARNADNHQLIGYKLSFQVGPTGNAMPQDELPPLVANGGAQVALALKPGTTVDTLGTNVDTGYTAEMWVDLTKIGYPANLGDHRLFLGVDLLDGDSFTPFTDSYGTRTWWQREFAGGSGAGGGGPDGPAWCWLDTNAQVPLAVGDPIPGGGELALLGNRPNPYRGSTSIDFILPRSSRVDLEVFDLQGRLVAKRDYGTLAAGTSHVSFNAKSLRSGIYPYRIRVRDGSGTQVLTGRMLLER